MSARVYVASPLGFTEATRLFYSDVLLPSLHAAGLMPCDPWAAGEPITRALSVADPGERRAALREANHQVGLANEELIGSSAGVLAVLDGADVDSGTASEIGWASAKGLPIVGWRSDFRQSSDNEGCLVNLQVEYFIHRSGGVIERDLGRAIETMSRLLEARA